MEPAYSTRADLVYQFQDVYLTVQDNLLTVNKLGDKKLDQIAEHKIPFKISCFAQLTVDNQQILIAGTKSGQVLQLQLKPFSKTILFEAAPIDQNTAQKIENIVVMDKFVEKLGS